MKNVVLSWSAGKDYTLTLLRLQESAEPELLPLVVRTVNFISS